MTSNNPTSGSESAGGGVVPRDDADPTAARSEVLTAGQGVERMVRAGYTLPDASRVVNTYLAEQTARHGEPDGGWRLDAHDLTRIAQRWAWVDHARGETIEQAQHRARREAADVAFWARQVDRTQERDEAADLDREVDRWTARAGGITVEAIDAQRDVDDALDRRDAATEAGDHDVADAWAGRPATERRSRCGRGRTAPSFSTGSATPTCRSTHRTRCGSRRACTSPARIADRPRMPVRAGTPSPGKPSPRRSTRSPR